MLCKVGILVILCSIMLSFSHAMLFAPSTASAQMWRGIQGHSHFGKIPYKSFAGLNNVDEIIDYNDYDPSALYKAPPYGRNFGHPHNIYPSEPLYYDPRDPNGGHYDPALKVRTYAERNQFDGAAYLPRGQKMRHHYDPMHPQFGYVPVNYIHANFHPFHFNQPFGAVAATAYHYHSMIPTTLPFPISKPTQSTIYRLTFLHT